MEALQLHQKLPGFHTFNGVSFQHISISRCRHLKMPPVVSAALADDSSFNASISGAEKQPFETSGPGRSTAQNLQAESRRSDVPDGDRNGSSSSSSSSRENGAVKLVSGREASSASVSESPSSRLVELPNSLCGVKDFLKQAAEFANITKRDCFPRWFCPLECGTHPQDAPLLLFLPGMDGTGLGMIRHHESLGRMFEVRCLHLPITNRTPIQGLMKLVENVVLEESNKAPSKPIYLVGDSLGGALALAVAARNPTVDLVLVLVNPSTSFERSQLQPILPLLDSFQDQAYQALPFLLSFSMGDPVQMAWATVDRKLPEIDKVQAMHANLISTLQMIPNLTDIVPKDTLKWKLELLKSAASYANSRLHAVKAEVLVLASGKDQMLPSADEALRLHKTLCNCVVRYYKDSGHLLLLEGSMDLGTVVRAAMVYRKSKKFDSITDFICPTTKEFEEVFERTKTTRKLISPVFFSTMEDGTIIQGLAGVPEEGPILLVGYHMLMGLEVTYLVLEFLKRKQVIRGVGHPILFTRFLEKGLVEPGFNDDVRVFGAFNLGKRNFYKVMARRECALLYPGGAREALHRKGEAYKLFWPEQSEFVRAAARFGVTIVPFGTVGEDDIFELVLDYNDIRRIPFLPEIFDEVNNSTPQVRAGQRGEVGDQELHMPLLLPKVPGRIYYLFGKPFQTAGRAELKEKQAADLAYAEMKEAVQNCISYLLQKRQEDPNRAFLPRFLYESLRGDDWQAQSFNP